MNYSLNIEHENNNPRIVARDTHVGDIMVITEEGILNGAILLHCNFGFVNLNNPGQTWNYHHSNLKVELIEPGTKIILTIT